MLHTEGKQADFVSGVEHIVGYDFTNKNLLWLALQAAGSGVFSIQELPGALGKVGYDGNKDIALLGNKVLSQTVVCHEIVDLRHSRSDVQPHISDALSNASLAKIGLEKGLDRFINMNPGHCGPVSKNMVANAVEAIVGAVYLDSQRSDAAVRGVLRQLGLIADLAAQPKERLFSITSSI